MMRRKLTKTERKIVYDKCNGHCAYCGREIPFKGFNVDHVLCMRNFEYMNESVDTVENMLPSCGSCNRYKSTYDLETFRKMLSGIPKRLARDVSTYNIAVRFGLVKECHAPIQFYFEKMNQDNAVSQDSEAAEIDQAIEYFKDELSQMNVFSDMVSFSEVERKSIETALRILQRVQEERQQAVMCDVAQSGT